MLEVGYIALALVFFGALAALPRWVPFGQRLFLPGLIAILVGAFGANWLFWRLLVEPRQ
jgi:hypothetical protein